MASNLVSEEEDVKMSVNLDQIQNKIEEYKLNAKCFEDVGNPLQEFQYLSHASSLIELTLESDVLTEEDRKKNEENLREVSDKLYNLQSEMGLVIDMNYFDSYQDHSDQSVPSLGAEDSKDSCTEDQSVPTLGAEDTEDSCTEDSTE